MTLTPQHNGSVDIDQFDAEPVSPEALALLDGLRDGAWLDQQTFPPLRYAVPGVLPEGFSLLVGPPKAGKSWMVLDIALAVASGGRALGHIAVGTDRPVLYLALEDGDRRMQARCRELLDTAPIPARFEYLTRIQPARVIDTVRAWLALRSGDTAPLVILDTLGKVMPPAVVGESAYQRDYRIGSALKRVVDDYPGASLVVIHHDRKATSDDFVEAVSGTNGLAGAADTIVVLVRPRGETDGLLKVTGRDVTEADYALTMAGGTSWRLDGTDLDAAATTATTRKASDGLGDRSTEIVRLIGQHPDGIGPTALGQLIGVEAKHAGEYLRRLASAGRVVKTGRGVYRSPHIPVESVETVETNPPQLGAVS
ncbi:helicase RepA family protein [Saccharopolyspora sp. K220]|uniref:AAA family ATPase n=1 Tax=Saccharopolyspora soli TaxID=2926618 RepID=UPI001F57B233|nr:AAA family ATPase [Saccharopolyspora soli]MCI2422754.1 helicase RepA family protein [Saccharopolyspora soli]